jgi:hypothetical protein
MQTQTEATPVRHLGLAIALAVTLSEAPVAAQQDPRGIAEVRETLARQQSLLETQSEQIELQARQLDEQRQVLLALQSRVDEMSMAQAPLELTESEIAVRERLARVEEVLEKPPDTPEDVLRAGELPGSIRLPGTNLAARLGGFVRLGFVDTFDPIGSDDRFVVGSIPVEGTEAADEARRFTISAKRSRLNLDMRMDSSVGQFRAFLEGDFAGDGGTDNYRLRHAYGQYKEFLIGQTWSTLTDQRAIPEDLDFEGLNGLVNFRQPMVRWSRVSEAGRRFAVGLEDPAPEITGGEGVSLFPDLIARMGRDRQWGHLQGGILLRDLVGTAEGSSGPRSHATAWGLSVSGAATMSYNGRDNLKFQLNYGEGIGRYINDLDSVGNQDAVFDPDGNLRALPAFGGYLSFQHWWNTDLYGLLRDLRSTFVYGLVNVRNLDFQEPEAYDRTQRATFNLIWSPISSIDLGVEFLHGERRNKDRSRGRARQFQAVATFRF